MRGRWAALVLAALAVVLLTSRGSPASPHGSSVRLISHGCSGTVIYSVSGRTLVLTCGHAFETAADRARPIVVNMPHPAPGGGRRVGVRLIGLHFDPTAQREMDWVLKMGRQPSASLIERCQRDLALVEIAAGPMPYVTRVAPAGTRPGLCWSMGYDRMGVPPAWRLEQHMKRPTTVTGYYKNETNTRESPVEGRSGGGLIDSQTRTLVGVVSAYQKDRAGRKIRGVYASHSEVLRCLRAWAPEALAASAGWISPAYGGPGGAWPPPPAPALRPSTPDCPT
jgi:hypothetical protein